MQKSTLGDIYVALEIPLGQAVVPIVKLSAVQFALGLTAVVVLSMILVKIAGKIVKPINMLSAAAARMSRGDYVQKLPVVTRDELGSLTEAFNTMAEGLRQRDFIRDTFGRYLTEEVVDRLLESEDGLTLGGDSRDVSILMSDVRGFSAHTADMPSERVLLLLNRYLGKMVEILLDHDAIVDEMVGDGILAVFGAPAPMEDHPARAVACALEMQAAMQSINSMNAADGLPRLEMGIGINTGNVVVGNIGSERRTKYGVVGAEVNFAGRIESYTVGGQLLISSSTFDRVRGIVDVRDVVNVEMKGFQGSVSLYDIRAIGHPYDVRLPETLDSPAPIEQRIRVMVARLRDKVVTKSDESAWITHLSENAAVLVWSEDLEERSEIKIDLLNDDGESMAGQVFAKVISSRACGERNEVVVRFTFVSPEIRSFFRHWLHPG
jgi:class 3 adenylate cyclase